MEFSSELQDVKLEAVLIRAQSFSQSLLSSRRKFSSSKAQSRRRTGGVGITKGPLQLCGWSQTPVLPLGLKETEVLG